MLSATTLKELFEDYLANFEEVLILCKPVEGLILPDSAMPKEGKTTVLVYGLDLATPIEDLLVTDEGVSATLSFQRTPTDTFVPWTALAMIQGVRKRPRQRGQLRSV